MWTGYSKQAHRFACLSLYKTLLSHAFHLPISNELSHQAITTIRRKFRSSKRLQGKKSLHRALRTAHENELLLRQACQNDTPAIFTITERLEAMISRRDHQREEAAKPPPPPPPPPPKPPLSKRRQRQLAMTPEQKAKRSLQHRRRPPIITITSGFPVLHYRGRKEKSRYVSHLLADKIAERPRMTVLRQYMEGEGQVLAVGEDIWDKQMARFGIESEEAPGGPTWTSCHDRHSRIVNYHMFKYVSYTETHLKRMHGIVEKWNEERRMHIRAYLREKRKRGRQRRLERERMSTSHFEGEAENIILQKLEASGTI